MLTFLIGSKYLPTYLSLLLAVGKKPLLAREVQEQDLAVFAEFRVFALVATGSLVSASKQVV